MITKLNIPCQWGGHLAGILLKNQSTTASGKTTKKFIGIHGWADNLNSLLPLAEKMLDSHPDYEIYLYDQPGHGFSDHLPKGIEYSYGENLRNLRTIIQTLAWNKEKFSIMGHCHGAHVALAYAAAYPEEIACLVALDALIGSEKSTNSFWKTVASRIDKNIEHYNQPSKIHKKELTYEKAIEIVKSTRNGIDDKSAALLVERSVQRDKHNQLYFTPDEVLRNRISMIITKFDIQCIWGGTLVGVLLKNDATATADYGKKTIKIIGIHGWLDNLNSLLPLATQLIERHPNYEIYLYDRAGHGFSSHIPKGFEYSGTHNTQDLRTVILSLGWNKEKFAIIGHSYGASLGIVYASTYPDEVICDVAIDAVPRSECSSENYSQIYASRIDDSIAFHSKPARTFEADLTFDKALELTKMTRTGISDEAARLLTERLIRRDTNNKLHFTRDDKLKLEALVPLSEEQIKVVIQSLKAPILFIRANNPQWSYVLRAGEVFKKNYPRFEMTLIDGPHHLHMTHVNEVTHRIEEFFDKYLEQTSPSIIEKSKL
ncbi:unnamed protein product [Adineta steineri]|uniref:AB hydrolase-1 domain-containing protein n=1 Tax=Adineta steineri TaxID=433720 RepID=A0A814LW36_9BILA|nr:unnamed protein product [Adineta steineri]